jgi:hypothetical protein
MTGKSAGINSSKTYLLQWSEIKNKQTKSVLKSIYIITSDVPGHMQMEITGSQNNDILKMAPKFCKDKKILK